MSKGVYLVLDADRDVLDVCEMEESAQAIARRQDATYEWWPISREPRDAAWHRVLSRTSGFSGPCLSGSTKEEQ